MMAERNIMGRINHPFIVKLRYAFQTEYEIYSSALGRHFDQNDPRFPRQVLSKDNYKAVFSHSILKSYKITDPRVVRLVDYSIAQILLGVPFK